MNLRSRPIVIYGSSGMLGQMASYFFEKNNYHVIPIDKRFLAENKFDYFNDLGKYPDAIILNCIAKIPQKGPELHELLWANSIFPNALAEKLMPSQLLIHPSTEGVFKGNENKHYSVKDKTEPTDDYSWSKLLGENILKTRKNCLIIRTSIIGPDKKNAPKGLLGWFLSQTDGSVVKGYINHIWNGITTLEWCKQVLKLLENDIHIGKNIMHLGTSDSKSKYELLLLFNNVFKRNIRIEPFEAPQAIDRRLMADMQCPSLTEQVQELAEMFPAGNF